MKKRLSNSLHEILMKSELTKLNILTENQLPLKKKQQQKPHNKNKNKRPFTIGVI